MVPLAESRKQQSKPFANTDHIRERPGMYLGWTDKRGLDQLALELVYNSLDEVLAGFGNRIDVDLLPAGGCRIGDHGSGIPVHKVDTLGTTYLEAAMTRHYGRKQVKRLRVDAFLREFGLPAVAALSRRVVVETNCNGQFLRQEFARGRVVTPLDSQALPERTGTSITFWPDTDIFGDATFDTQSLHARLRQLAYLNAPLLVHFRDCRHRDCLEETFHSPGGLADMLLWESRNSSVVHPNVIHAHTHVPEGSIEIAFCWLRGSGCTIHSFANFARTSQGGSHANALVRGIVEAWQRRFPADRMLRNGRPVLIRHGCRWGLFAVVHVLLQAPRWEGAILHRMRLHNPEIEAPVRSLARRTLEEFIRSHTDEAAAIIRHILAPESTAAHIRHLSTPQPTDD